VCGCPSRRGQSRGGCPSLYGVASGSVPPLQRVAHALPEPTRRQLLAGVAGVAAGVVAAGVSGCASTAGDSAASAADGDAVDEGDLALADRAAGSAAMLLAAYRATVRRHRSLRSLLDPLADHHAEHVQVFAPDAAPPSGRPAAVPRSSRRAIAALGSAERRTAGARRRDVLAADSGDLARALASAAACQAQHVVLLDGAAG